MPSNNIKVKSQKPKVETKKVQKAEVKASAKTGSVSKKASDKVYATVSAPMYDSKGAKDGSMTLPKEVFGTKINKALMSQAVRVYLANQRQGNAKTKTRGEIDLTKAKWFRQKGTGRARHGAQSAPIFVGGGVAHGPKLRDYSLKMPQKMKKAALFSALSQRAKDGDIKVVSGLLKIEPKTKNMSVLLTKLTEDKKRKTSNLLVTSARQAEIENVYRAGKNIKNLELININLINTYEILKYKNLFLMKEAVELIGKTGSVKNGEGK
jgi:large subunit ribosomal protein L4